MECRQGCGACCIAPSIESPIPNMPAGKPAGAICANLDTKTWNCKIWGQDNYPDLCRAFMPNMDSCGETREEAITLLNQWEQLTQPDENPSKDS